MSVTEHSITSVTPPKLKNGTFSVDERDMKRLEALAKAENDSVSGLLRKAVKGYIESQVGDIDRLDAQMAAIHEAELKLNNLYASIRTKQ
jgi:predicted transcriptional regulator